jgi:polyisoprenoid-binding protein YceI
MWRVDTAAVTFEIHNAGLPVHGSFDHVEARVCFDPMRPEASSLSGTIDPGSIHTGIAMRDRHLHRRGWFEIARFETIEMRSVQLRRTSAGYAGTFALRIRDVQREVEVPFTFERRNERARLTGELTIDRLDYGLGKPSLVLSDDVTIRVELSLVPETPTDTGRAGGNCTAARAAKKRVPRPTGAAPYGRRPSTAW